jgi:hypothetical protein
MAPIGDKANKRAEALEEMDGQSQGKFVQTVFHEDAGQHDG